MNSGLPSALLPLSFRSGGQLVGDPREDATPVSPPLLAEQAHRGIPRAIAALPQPPPVARVGKGQPDRDAERSSQVCQRCIGADQEIEVLEYGARVDQVVQTPAERDHGKSAVDLIELFRAEPFLQAEETHA